jgi:hypothetical protein
MAREWKAGDRVVVVTINRGLPELTTLRGRKGQSKSHHGLAKSWGRARQARAGGPCGGSLLTDAGACAHMPSLMTRFRLARARR